MYAWTVCLCVYVCIRAELWWAEMAVAGGGYLPRTTFNASQSHGFAPATLCAQNAYPSVCSHTYMFEQHWCESAAMGYLCVSTTECASLSVGLHAGTLHCLNVKQTHIQQQLTSQHLTHVTHGSSFPAHVQSGIGKPVDITIVCVIVGLCQHILFMA